jgi:hypothetical protein
MNSAHHLAIEIMSECGKSPQEIAADPDWDEPPSVRDVELSLGLDMPSPRYRPRFITYQGKTRTVSDWAKIKGFSRQALSKRLKKMTISEAMMAPVRRNA